MDGRNFFFNAVFYTIALLDEVTFRANSTKRYKFQKNTQQLIKN